MAKISTYEISPIPNLDDKVIGTSIAGPPDNNTNNFTLSDILDLFLPEITLQTVLNAGNTATQTINLTGNINATSFYTNGYGFSDDGSFQGSTYEFPLQGGAYLQYSDNVFHIWDLPSQSGTIALTSDIVNTSGRIRLSDPSNTFFNSLASARTYVESYTNASITDEYYSDDVYVFTVPYGSQFDLSDNFCSDGNMSFKDPDGRVVMFGAGCFNTNNKDNIFGNITVGDNFLINSVGNNIFGDVNATDYFLNGSSGNNIIKNLVANDNCLSYSSGNNIFINVEVNDNFLQYSAGNNIIKGDVVAGNKCLFSSGGNNIINNGTVVSDNFLANSTGNNTMKNVLARDFAFSGSVGNNTMVQISVQLNAFREASPSIKNSVFQIVDCGGAFALNYTNRMDVTLFGTTGGQDLPGDIFTTSNLAWIHTAWSNQYNNSGGEDDDVTNARNNLDTNGSGQSTVIFD